MWEQLLKDGANINFAYKTFRWDSEARLKAHVHCVIIGFSYNVADKYIYSSGQKIKAKNINPYLIDDLTIFIENRSKPLCDVAIMNYGSMPIDDGHLILNEEEKEIIFKESSNRPQTLKAAQTPYLFGEIRQPNTNMLVIPKVSSETRKYLPIDFKTPDIIVNGSALIVPNANLYSFGILNII